MAPVARLARTFLSPCAQFTLCFLSDIRRRLLHVQGLGLYKYSDARSREHAGLALHQAFSAQSTNHGLLTPYTTKTIGLYDPFLLSMHAGGSLGTVEPVLRALQHFARPRHERCKFFNKPAPGAHGTVYRIGLIKFEYKTSTLGKGSLRALLDVSPQAWSWCG